MIIFSGFTVTGLASGETANNKLIPIAIPASRLPVSFAIIPRNISPICGLLTTPRSKETGIPR
jgi:hypothetical protein